MTDIPPIKKPPHRILYSMIRVSDLEVSIDFYKKALGMHVLRKESYTEGRFTLVFMGYGSETQHTVLELTHNWDPRNYQHGNRYGHLAVEVIDIFETCRQLSDIGIDIIREPGPMQFSPDEVDHVENIAFILDPDGYRIELIEQSK